MKKAIFLLLVIVMFAFTPSAFAEQLVNLDSPDPQIKIQVDVDSIHQHMTNNNTYMVKMQKIISAEKAATMESLWQKVTIIESTEEIDYNKHVFRTLKFTGFDSDDNQIIKKTVPSKWKSFDSSTVIGDIEKIINDNKEFIEGKPRY